MYPSNTAPERYADGIVHAVSLVGFAVAGVFLLRAAAAVADPAIIAAAAFYVPAVLFSIGISFAYHLWPRHEPRPILRRWDHAAIYLVIVGTFGPLLTIAGTWTAYTILAVSWLFALVGVWFKLFGSNPYSRWSLVSYLGLGWFALAALPDFWSTLPGLSTATIAAGGLFYTLGTFFYSSKTIRYRYAIWHAFGTLGGTSFFAAIWMALPA